MSRRLLFLGKLDDHHCAEALALCRRHFDVQAHLGQWGDRLPEEARAWRGDFIVSYLSRWVVPQALLDRAESAAINFHPASPDYPGIGCVNFALYEDASSYGATCHHMEATVDTGPIIEVVRCPVRPDDTVASLLERSYDAQFSLFARTLDRMLAGEALLPSGEQWGRAPFTRRQFDQLGILRPDMDDLEIARRSRAVTFREYAPIFAA